MNLEEVASEKVWAIESREKARDVQDLYYLVKEKSVKFDRDAVNAKLGHINRSYSKGAFKRSLKSKNVIFDKELENLVFGPLPKFGEVKKTIEEWAIE